MRPCAPRSIDDFFACFKHFQTVDLSNMVIECIVDLGWLQVVSSSALVLSLKKNRGGAVEHLQTLLFSLGIRYLPPSLPVFPQILRPSSVFTLASVSCFSAEAPVEYRENPGVPNWVLTYGTFCWFKGRNGFLVSKFLVNSSCLALCSLKTLSTKNPIYDEHLIT